jgi:hypothetical protein
MDIKNVRPDPTPARPAAPVTPAREDARRAPGQAPDRAEQRDDRVEISDAARSRAARVAASDVPSGTLPAERLVELRRRIQERVHDSPVMADEVMRAIVERGDL